MTDPIGVPPSSTHVLNPYCTVDQIPAGRLLDSNGKPIGDVQIEFAIAAATELLYHLSGRKYRSGRSVVRPTQIARDYWSQSFTYPYNSTAGGMALDAGWAWSGLGRGWWSGQDQSEVVLQGPVTAVHSVTVDGVALNPTDFAVYDRRRLVRVFDPAAGSTGAWPWNQNLSLPATEAGTFQVDYSWGAAPGAGGVLACASLAVDLALALSGQDGHRLPARVLSVATQGTNVAVGDALEFLKDDLTGIPAVDLWLRAVNPGKRRRRAMFAGPGTVIQRES